MKVRAKLYLLKLSRRAAYTLAQNFICLLRSIEDATTSQVKNGDRAYHLSYVGNEFSYAKGILNFGAIWLLSSNWRYLLSWVKWDLHCRVDECLHFYRSRVILGLVVIVKWILTVDWDYLLVEHIGKLYFWLLQLWVVKIRYR